MKVMTRGLWRKMLLITGFVAILVASSTTAVWAAAECIAQPLGYWALEETSEPYADNISPGTAGACTSATECPSVASSDLLVGNAQFFAAIDNTGINIPGTAAADAVFDWAGTDSFSISVWFRTNSSNFSGSNEVLVGRIVTGGMQWWLGLKSDGGPRFFIVDSTDNNGDTVDGTTNLVDDGLWHLLVAVRDGVNNQDILYVDGDVEVVVSSPTDGGGAPSSFTGNFTAANIPVNIGHFNGNFHFTGALDEAGLWGEALSATQVQQLYDYGKATFPRGYCNQLPVIDSISGAAATENAAYSVTATATDPEGDLPLTWAKVSGPADLTIDPSSGLISWTPPDNSVSGNIDVIISATDFFQGTSEKLFQIAVTAVNDAPTITSTATTNADVGTAYTYTPTADDPDNLPSDLTWSLSSNAPSAMTVDASTGAISWTPVAGEEGDHTFSLTVNDGSGGSASEPITLTVTNSSTPAGTPSSGGGGGGGCFITSLN